MADIDRIRFTKNGEAFAFVFVPDDLDVTTIPKPPSASRLEELGAADTGAATTPDSGSSTTIAGSTSSIPAGTETTVTTVAPAAAAPPTTGG